MSFFYKIPINNYMKDYIYIIQNEDNCIKIGISKHPDKRLKQLQTGNQSKLHLVFTEEFECKRKHLLNIEKYIHKKCTYLCKHKKGEWFTIDIDDMIRLQNFITYCRIRYENDITLGSKI